MIFSLILTNGLIMFRFLLIAAFLIGWGTMGLAQEPHNFKMDPEKVDCHKLPSSFESMDHAAEIIENAKFRYGLRFQTTKPKGVMAGSYHSCDNKTAFLILTIDDKKIVFSDFTMKAWNELTETNDPDGYYSAKIKRRFSLVQIDP